MPQFQTTAAYLSGAICGSMWWPVGQLGGRPINKNLRGPWGIMDRFSEPASFRDALLHLLMEEGGDFSGASFSADTVIRIERRKVESPGKYTVHTKELQLDQIGCEDLVNEEAYNSDFFGDCE